MKLPDLIVTSRLVLRRHTAADLPAFAEFLTHPTATRYMAFTAEQQTPAGARQLLEYVIASYATEEPVFSLTIADPGTEAYLGSCGAQPLPSGVEIEVFYTVVPAQQRQGLATEAARAVVEYLFASTDCEQLVAHVVPENVASVRVAEKLGFVHDGPIDRPPATGDMPRQSLLGVRYVLRRPAAK